MSTTDTGLCMHCTADIRMVRGTWEHTGSGEPECVTKTNGSFDHAAPVEVGTGATVLYYTDTRAAVVVSVALQSVVLARVEVDQSTRRVRNPREPWPCVVFDGDLARPVEGTELRYSRRGNRWMRGSTRAVLGKSVETTDYRR